MKEQIAALRNWAATRAKNASIIVREEEQKEMPILLTRPELELERSFDLNNSKENKFGVYNSVAPTSCHSEQRSKKTFMPMVLQKRESR